MYGGFRKDKKDEEDGSGGGSNPFAGLEKTAVLQEARVFNETPVNPRKCTHILAKILYLLQQVGYLPKFRPRSLSRFTGHVFAFQFFETICEQFSMKLFLTDLSRRICASWRILGAS